MKNKSLITLLALLLVLSLGMGIWAVSGQVRISRLNNRIADLESRLILAEQSKNTSASANPDAIAAEFNGGVVTAAEAAEEYALISGYYEMMGMTEAEYGELAKMTVIDGLVEEKILQRKAEELGVYKLSDEKIAQLEAQVQADYESLIAYNMGFSFDDTKTEAQLREETIAYMAENGESYENLLQAAMDEAWREQLYTHITSNMTISDDQLKSFYDSQVESAQLSYSASFYAYELDSEGGRRVLWHPEGVREVQAVEISFSADQAVEYLTLQAAAENGDATARDKLAALYESLEPVANEAYNRAASGEDFTALMQEYGASAYTNISEKSTICGDNYRNAAMGLAHPGDISQPVQTEGGLCIIRYVRDIPAGTVPFEEVKDELLANYSEELKTSLYNSTIVSWLQEADIQYHLDTF